MKARRFSVQAFWGLTSWLLPLVIVFLVTPRLLHLLGSERFGILMIVLVTPVVASQLDFGIGSSAIRRLAAELKLGRINGPGLLFSYAVAFCAIALALGTLVALGAPWLANALGFSAILGDDAACQLTQWCALWGAVALFSVLPSLVARAAQQFGWMAAVQTLATVVLWVGAWQLIGTGAPLLAIVILGILVSGLSAGAMILAGYGAVCWRGPLSFRPSILTHDMRFASGMFFTQIASAIVYQGDRILISSFGSPAIAGSYALCVNLANKPLAAVAAITSFAFPHAAGLHSRDARDELSTLLNALDRAVAVLVVPLLLPALSLAQPFLVLWLGEYGTSDLALAFQILLVAFAVSTFSVPVGHVLAASGRSGPAAMFSWLAAAVVLAGIAALVPQYGLLGATVAMLVGMSTSLIFNIVARHALALKQEARNWNFWTGAGLGAVMQAVVLMLLRQYVSSWWSLILVAGVGWASFFFVRTIMKALTPEEVQLLDRLRKTVSSVKDR